MSQSWWASGLAGAAFLLVFGAQQQQKQDVPDAPSPQQTTPSPLGDLKGKITPGQGTTPDSNGDTTTPPAATPSAPGSADQTPGQTQDQSGDQAPGQQTPPQIPKPAELEEQLTKIGTTNVNFVVVPVTVRDNKNVLVAGLTWRDFEILEDSRVMHLNLFSTDSLPMSVALVVDQSLPSDVMSQVNDALGAVQGAFTAADEVAVFTYANGPEERTEFTAGQGARLGAVIQRSKAHGRDMGAPISTGPLAEGPQVNGHSFDPNLSPQHNGGGVTIVPKDVHTLNDAIFMAAQELAKRERDRRRVVYVISDGKESGSKVSQKEVIRFLLTNQIGLYGTVVGESATFGIGYLDKIHLPLLPRNNVLPAYALATGGTLDSELYRDGMERSFQRITEAARAQYTLGYNSPVPLVNPAYRKIEVRVMGHGKNLNVTAKEGYYPTPTRQH